MQAAHIIREAMTKVAMQRQQCMNDSYLAKAVSQIKCLQARRFAGTYADLLREQPYDQAVQFFLDELYADQDFSRRDQQFSKIAGALERLFPKEVVATAVTLAELHACTEELDFAMGRAWLGLEMQSCDCDAARYVAAWRQVGRRDERDGQLRSVLELGREIERLTQAPGLRMMLRMMRKPATVAGLGDLQHFLESGFDKFSAMAQKGGLTQEFLRTIEKRETEQLAQLFEADLVTCATQLELTLGLPR